MTTILERTLRLRPEFEVIPLDDGAVLLRSPDQGMRVRVDGTPATDLARMLRALDGARPPGTVRDGRDAGDGFEALLRGLVARGVVDVDALPVPDSDLGRFFSQFHDDPAACMRRLVTSSVLVVGAGAVAEGVGRALGDAGIGRLATAPGLNGHASDTGGAHAAVATAPLEDLARACRRADLVVYADAVSTWGPAYYLNKLALEMRFPWLAVRVFGSEGFVGPLFVPGDGPCLACLLARETANWVDPELTRAYLDRITTEPTSVDAYGRLPTLVALASQWAGLEAVKFLSGFIVSALLGTVLRVDVVACRTQLHRVPRLPRCRECSPCERRPGVNGLLYGGRR